MEARARGTAYARAALAGNPSDGYGGTVLAVTIRNFAAEVMLETASEMEVEPVGASDLVRAAVARFSRRARTHAPGSYRATSRTSIPRQVGLAGSSAILVATLRALCELHETEMDADELADLAWRAETQDVGYPAGGQDPYAQAHEGLVLMDFSGEVQVERLDPADLPPLFLAYRVDAADGLGPARAQAPTRLARQPGELLDHGSDRCVVATQPSPQVGVDARGRRRRNPRTRGPSGGLATPGPDGRVAMIAPPEPV